MLRGDGGHQLKALPDLPRDLAAAISRVKFDSETGAVTEVVLANKIEAGNVLLRSLGSIREGMVQDIAINRIERVIIAAPPVSAPVLPEQAGQAGPDNCRSRIDALTVRRVTSG